MVALLRRALGEAAIPALETSVRQAAAEERETVLMFRNGQTEEAVLRKVGNGTCRIVPGDETTCQPKCSLNYRPVSNNVADVGRVPNWLLWTARGHNKHLFVLITMG